MLEKGQIAPEFSLKDADGKAWPLRNQLRQGRVLAVFFKISCPTCQLTLPYLDRLPPALPVIGISQDDAAGTKDFLQHFKIRFPVAMDPGKSYAVSNIYRLTNVPSMFRIEADGKISWASHGFVRAELEQMTREAGVEIFREGDAAPAMKPG